MVQYSNSAVNRFSFVGVEILSTFLIGLVEAQNTDRNLYSASLTTRYGLTNRAEFEIKVPYIYREERVEATIPQAQSPEGQPNTMVTRNLQGEGLGDVEAALHYQLNRGGNGWPFLVGNLRYKSTTGRGPFDTGRDANGLGTELATGSGFESVEPSLTILAPVDPALFFANVGYLYNHRDTLDEVIIPAQGGNQPAQIIGEVNPGDVVRTSFGLGHALNEQTSMTLGYKHDFIRKTRTEINEINFYSSSLSVGSLLVGYSFRPFKKTAVNVNLEIGVTGDAPDVVVTLRTPRALN